MFRMLPGKELRMKLFKWIACFLLAFVLSAGTFAVPGLFETNAVEAADDTFVDNKNGTVQITFTVDKDTTVLILVTVPEGSVKKDTDADTKKASNYYYKLSTGKNVVDIPLTRGSGNYKIRICKVLDTGKAAVLSTKEISLSEKNSTSVFEVSNFVVNYGLKDSYIEKASSLIKGSKTESDKVKKIYNFIVKNFAYDYELLSVKQKTSYYNPDNFSTYDRKLGICYDISALFVSMLRSVDVDARIVTGHTPNVKEYHAWSQVWDSKKKKWYTIDCTYDMCLYNAKSKKKYTMVKKDSEYSDIVYYY